MGAKLKDTRKSTFVLWLPLVLYWLLVLAFLFIARERVGTHLVYPLDDTYIHMAIAKHFAIDGLWGVALNGFSSSTSSPLWTFLIFLLYKIFGVNDWVALLLSILFGSLLVYLYSFILSRDTSPVGASLLTSALMLLVPLPVLTLTGMEHILHSVLTLLLIYYVAAYLEKRNFIPALFLRMVLVANLTVITRYEGLFLISVAAVLFVAEKRFWEGVLFGTSSLFLAGIYGLVSFSKGWFFLPNSVLLKGNKLSVGTLPAFITHVMTNFYVAPQVLVLIVGCLVTYFLGKQRIGDGGKRLVALGVLTAFLHMLFASAGWSFRYEAYLISSLGVIFLDILSRFTRKPSASDLSNRYFEKVIVHPALLATICIPLVARAGLYKQYPIAVQNIYEQQYQMGLFVQRYYDRECVVANDIGAINYLADICLVDLVGLANVEVARHRLNGTFAKEFMQEITNRNDVAVIMIYRNWFPDIPDDWIKVGSWQIVNNVVCGGDKVTFYATSENKRRELFNNLMEFSTTLPGTVQFVYSAP